MTVRASVLLTFAAFFAVLVSAAMMLSMEPVVRDTHVKASLPTSQVHGTHLRVAHGHHAAAFDDGDDDVDDNDGDDFDVSGTDDDMEDPPSVAGDSSPESQAAPDFLATTTLGPSRGHSSLPEHPPRPIAS